MLYHKYQKQYKDFISFTTPIQHFTGRPSYPNNKKSKQKCIKIGNKAIKLFLFIDNMIFKNPKQLTKK